MEEAPSSITQGCFLFNAASFKSSSILTGTFQRLPGETSGDAATKRAQVYHKLRASTKSKIEEITTHQHEKLFDDLVKFVEESSLQLSRLPSPSGNGVMVNEDGDDEVVGSSSTRLPLPPRLEIPTAVMVAGVNMPDHNHLFKQLKSRILSSVSTHVVQLQSEACGSGIKTAWKEILSQLTSETVG